MSKRVRKTPPKYCEIRKNDKPIGFARYNKPKEDPNWQGPEYTFHYYENIGHEARQVILDAIRVNSRPVIYDTVENLDRKNLPPNVSEIIVKFLQEQFFKRKE